MEKRTTYLVIIGVVLLATICYAFWERGFDFSLKNKLGSENQLTFMGPDEKLEEECDSASVMNSSKGQIERSYPWHKGITATIFWIGEDESHDNGFVSNHKSTWDGNWIRHYGGEDDPEQRKGYFPASFKPKENPFYFALPYNDFDETEDRKYEAEDIVYWSWDQKWCQGESMLKNRWVAIKKGRRIAFAQWEDTGPFNEDDSDYVFGEDSPANETNSNVGISVSPAVRDYLNLADVDFVSWRFVERQDVADGPWKKVITSSGVSW